MVNDVSLFLGNLIFKVNLKFAAFHFSGSGYLDIFIPSRHNLSTFLTYRGAVGMYVRMLPRSTLTKAESCCYRDHSLAKEEPEWKVSWLCCGGWMDEAVAGKMLREGGGRGTEWQGWIDYLLWRASCSTVLLLKGVALIGSSCWLRKNRRSSSRYTAWWPHRIQVKGASKCLYLSGVRYNGPQCTLVVMKCTNTHTHTQNWALYFIYNLLDFSTEWVSQLIVLVKAKRKPWTVLWHAVTYRHQQASG